MSLLNIENLSIDFATTRGVTPAVRDVSLAISDGEVLGLVGESGSGKSVLALSVLGLLPESARVSGKIIFESKAGRVDLLTLDAEALRAVRGAEIAMIFQEPMTSLNPVYTIGSQISEAIEVHGKLTRARCQARVKDVLMEVRIPDPERIAASYPHELSGGMRQRAMIAMALACRPRLLLIDEPTTALDVTVQAQILALLRQLQRELRMAMLFITHDLGVLAQIAERIAVLQAGRLVECAEAVQLFSAPQQAYTQRLLAAVPRFKEL